MDGWIGGGVGWDGDGVEWRKSKPLLYIPNMDFPFYQLPHRKRERGWEGERERETPSAAPDSRSEGSIL